MAAGRTRAAKLPIQESSGRGGKRSNEAGSTAGQLSLFSFLRPAASGSGLGPSSAPASSSDARANSASNLNSSASASASASNLNSSSAQTSPPPSTSPEREQTRPQPRALDTVGGTSSVEASTPRTETTAALSAATKAAATTAAKTTAKTLTTPSSAAPTPAPTSPATGSARVPNRGGAARGGGRLSLSELYQKNVSTSSSSSSGARGRGLFGVEVQSGFAALRIPDTVPDFSSTVRGVDEGGQAIGHEASNATKLPPCQEAAGEEESEGGQQGAAATKANEGAVDEPGAPLMGSPIRPARRRLSTKGPPAAAKAAAAKTTPRSKKKAAVAVSAGMTTPRLGSSAGNAKGRSAAGKQGQKTTTLLPEAEGKQVGEAQVEALEKGSRSGLGSGVAAAAAVPGSATATTEAAETEESSAAAAAAGAAAVEGGAEGSTFVNEPSTEASEAPDAQLPSSKRKPTRRALGAPGPAKRSRKTGKAGDDDKENVGPGEQEGSAEDAQTPRPAARKLAKEADSSIKSESKRAGGKLAGGAVDEEVSTKKRPRAELPGPAPGSPTTAPTLNSELEADGPRSKEDLGSASSGRLTLRERLARRTSVPGGSRSTEALPDEGPAAQEAEPDQSGQDHKKLGGLTLQWRLMFEGNRHPSKTQPETDEPPKPKEAKPAPLSPLMPRAFNTPSTTTRSRSPMKKEPGVARDALADRGTSPTVATPPQPSSNPEGLGPGAGTEEFKRRASRGSPGPLDKPEGSMASDMAHATVSELKAALLARGIALAGCVEKADLLGLWQRTLGSPSRNGIPDARGTATAPPASAAAGISNPRRPSLGSAATSSTNPFCRGLSSADIKAPPQSSRRSSLSGRPPDRGTTSPFLDHAQHSAYTPPPPPRDAPCRTSPNDESEPAQPMSFKEAREVEARREVTRILGLRQEMFPNLSSWGHEVLKLTRKENMATGGAAAHKCYRSLMKQLHPDKVEQTPLVSKAVDLVREARDAVERSILRTQPPGKPRALKSEMLCSKLGQRQLKLLWKPPPELPDSPVSRYVVAVVDPSFGRPLAVATLEADYCPELGRFMPIEERTSFVLEEKELVKMPKLWQQARATVQVAAGNDAGQSGWSILQVPLTA